MTTTLARKTRRAFFFVLFTPLLLGIIVAIELRAYQESVDWVAHTNLVLSTMDHLLLAMTRAESAQRGFLLTRSNGYVNWYSKAQVDADSQIVKLNRLTADNATQQQYIASLKNAVENRFQTLDLLIQRTRSATLTAEELSRLLQDGTSKMEQIWDITHHINENENNLLGTRLKTERNTEFGVAASFAVCILVNLGVLVWAYRLITRFERARELAAEQILQMNSELEIRVSERTSELELANAQLKRSNDDLSKFAYIASHDLQEPLRTVGSYVGLLSLRYRGQLDEQADRYIKFVVDGAKRMQNLVQDLLIYSRVGTQALRLTLVNTDSVLRNIRENLDLLIREHQVSILSSPLPTLTADESKLTQVFTNLVSNAIKFQEPGRLPRISIEAERAGAEWIFTVIDNGIGFDQQYADRIFAIFQRLHGVGAYPGTGIGLAICKRIVEQHGGRIWATSVPGQGSSFSFSMPVEMRLNAVKGGTSVEDDRMGAEAVSK